MKNVISNNAPSPHRYIYSNYPTGRSVFTAMRSNEWKFIYEEKEDKAQLYDLRQDPKELNNLSGKLPEKVGVFLKEYKEWKKKIQRFGLIREERKLARPEVERLRTLGYIE